jgi:glycerol uptake facilitator-like aquaporin
MVLYSSGALVLKLVGEGTLTANGTEQTVFESAEQGVFEGWIDLANMASGDTTVIKIYVKTKTDGTYRLYDSASYSDAQLNPAVHIIDLAAKGFKVTLQQTSGSYKTYDYQIFRRL